jgi:hypothetical protein
MVSQLGDEAVVRFQALQALFLYFFIFLFFFADEAVVRFQALKELVLPSFAPPPFALRLARACTLLALLAAPATGSPRHTSAICGARYAAPLFFFLVRALYAAILFPSPDVLGCFHYRLPFLLGLLY